MEESTMNDDDDDNGNHHQNPILQNLRESVNLIESSSFFAHYVPEVRTNIAYAREGAKTLDDVAAIDGRITIVKGKPRACGEPGFGVSSHMARTVIEMMKIDPGRRAVINFKVEKGLVSWLEDYCKQTGRVFAGIDRSKEPEGSKEIEGQSMPWKIRAALEETGGMAPDLTYCHGAVGKEDMFNFSGTDALTCTRDVLEILRTYHEGRRKG